MLINDKEGWYVTRPNIDPAEEEIGEYDKERRARDLTADYGDVVELSVERTLYALTSYKRPEAFERWQAATFDREEMQYEYADEKPSPNKDDLVAVSAWGDIDLADELKTRRPDLDADTYSTAETALEAYIDAFAELYGGRDAVYALDSVGGAYIFGAPEATLPIAREFAGDPEDRARVMGAFIERSNEYLKEAEERVNAAVDDASEVVHPDWANNPNRQYKMPMSIHADHDAVVTPLSTDSVTYREPTPVGAVDEDLLDRTRRWCESFTRVQHEDRVDEIVATLWPDYYADADSWEQALQEWLFDRESERLRKEQQREQRKAALEEGEVVELKTADVTLTTDQSDVKSAIDALNPEQVIEDTILGAGWTDRLSGTTDRSGDGRRAFVPTWANGYNSGNATFVGVNGSKSGVWHDSDDGSKGGLVEAALIAHSGRSNDAGFAEGEEWREGVDVLRRLGYDIPVWVPDATSLDEDQMPLWALRKFALKLGVVEQHELVERTGDDGSSYLGFRPSDYRRVVRRAEAAGLDTGRRDHLDDGGSSDYYEVDLQEYTSTEQSPYADPDTMLAACIRARADGAVPEDAEPPTLALVPILRDVGMDKQVGETSPGTRSMAVDVFREDLNTDDVQDDDTVTIYD
ncbi:hypothetical protein [Halorubrum sp. SD683]|uniref:hypothetical protein n=1 Tax=Halorubrum sp. SD683 TaxID=1855873 RepID=UPI001302D148|nr:hypothetical protein [Halorubrum sp. SD683]